MKTIAVLGTIGLALVVRNAEAFFLPAGNLVGGASTTAPLTVNSGSGSSSRIVARAAARGSGCSCPSCKAGTCGRSCRCPSCFKGLSARSHAAGCRCGVCSVRMRAHPAGCGCGDCSPAAFHSSCCNCANCSYRSRAEPCACSVCTSRPGGRGASSATVIRMGAGQVSDAGEGIRERLVEEPGSVMFEEAMGAIEAGFDYTPKRFVNGATSSGAGENEGSCKVFAFGKIAGLSPDETLACFGEHYRSVLADPGGDSHGNIRAFMESGWDGVEFPDGLSLSPK